MRDYPIDRCVELVNDVLAGAAPGSAVAGAVS
jgi:hypothetical protein